MNWINDEFRVSCCLPIFSHTCLSPVRGTGVAHLPTWLCVHRVPHPASNFVIVAGKVRLTQVATRGEGQPAGGREWARVALKDKELHRPQFLLVLHISLSSIYITLHIFQVHTKCILYGIINYLIWFEDGYSILQLLMRLTSPMCLIEQKNKCLSCICHTETCDSELSFHESEQTVPAVNAISSDFLCIIFLCESFGVFFPRNICQAKVLRVFLCVCTCTNLLVLNTEVKRMLCTWTQ